MPGPSNIPISIGICVTPSLDLAALELLSEEPAFPSGIIRKVRPLEVSGGNVGNGVKALALFFLLTSIVQRSESALFPSNEPILKGFAKSPAQSLTFALLLKDGSLRKWQSRLFGRIGIFNYITEFYLEVCHKTSSRPYGISLGTKMPLVEVYLESSRVEIGPDSTKIASASLSYEDLLAAARRMVESSANSWPGYELPSWVSNAEEKQTHASEGKSLDLLHPWFHALETDQRWNSLFIPPFTRLPLDEVYTDLYLVKANEFISTSYSAVSSTRGQSSLQWKTSIDSFLLGMQSHGVIIGGPGAGKSTLVRRIAGQLDKSRTIPLVVLLREFAEVNSTRPDLDILDYFFERECKQPTGATSEARKALLNFRDQQGAPEILLILDGWDEVPTDLRPLLLPKIERERADFKTLITTRPSGIPASIAHNCDRVAQISSLSPQSARALIINVCHALGREGFIHRIFYDLDQNPALNELASNPFTLTLVSQITCQRIQKLGQAERLTEIISQAVDLVQLYQEAVPELPKIRPEELIQLETIAREMSFGGPQKRLQFSAAPQEPPFEETGIAKSRLLDRLHLIPNSYGFVHLRYQEYFAGRGVVDLPEKDLLSLLHKFGLAWDWLEEWRFTAGTLEPSSKNFRVFWNYWKDVLKKPDLFGGIYCYAAWLVIEAEAKDGGADLVGLDLRDSLLSNIFEGRWIEESTRALIPLDMGQLALGLTAAIQHKSLPHEHVQSVLELITPVIRETTGLNEFLKSREDFSEYAHLGNNRVSPPTGLAQHRKTLRDSNNDPNRRSEAFKSISGYEDHDSIEDAKALLQSEDWNLFVLATRKLHEISSPEAAIILTKKVINLLGTQQKEAIDLIVSKLQLRRNGILEPCSRDLLLTEIHERGMNDPTLVPLLEALAGLPLMSEAEPLVNLLENTGRVRIRFAAATALGCCSDSKLVPRILNFMQTSNEDRLTDRILSSLAQGRHDLTMHFEWLWELFLRPGQRATIKNSLLNLLQNGILSDTQQSILEGFIVENIRLLSEGGDAEVEILTQKSLRNIGPFNRERTSQLLVETTLNDELAIETRELACSLLEACGVSSPAPVLVKILTDYWRHNPTGDKSDRFESSLVRAILALDPDALITALRNDDWKSLPRIQGQLRLWSDRNKRFIFKSAPQH